MSLVDQLLEMGFSRLKAEKAIEESGNVDLESAIVWLMSHEDDINESNDKADTSDSSKNEDNADVEAKSLKCDDCGKLFKADGKELELHAERTGHSNFSESTEEIRTLNDEEKQAQLLKLQERIKLRRGERIEKEKKDELQREISRRTTGKQLSSIKAEFAEKEMKKIAEERKREKESDRVARQKVKDDIERDRKERAARNAKSSAKDQISNTTANVPITNTSNNSVNYDKCRIQFRLPDGSTLVQQFGSKEPLAAVRLFVQINRKDDQSSFSLKTTFPTKTFTEDDMEKTLTILGLVPSATIIVSK